MSRNIKNVLFPFSNPFSNDSMLISFFWERRKKIAPGLMLALLRSVMLAPIPVSFKLIIDRCIPSRNMPGIEIIGCCVAVLLSLHYLLAVKGAKKVSARIASIIMELRGRIFLQIQQLSFAYLDQESTGRLLSKYAFDTQKVQTVAMQVLNQLLPNTLYSLCVLLTLIYLNWRLTFLLLLIIPLIAILKFRFFGEIKDAHSKARLAQERLTGAAGESLTALRLVRSFGEEERANWLLENRSRGVADAFSTSSTVSSQFTTFVSVSNQLLSLIVIAGGAVVAIKAGISMGTLLAFVTGLPALTMPAQMFAQISDQFFQGEESFRSIQELLDCPSLENWTGATKIRNLRGEIEFRDVSFAYPSTKKGAINEISLHIRPGENIALVGPSGSGKSTLASLILGLYRPDRGEIRIDGHLHTDLDMQWLRKQTAIVMQDTILLSGSIADNIRFASTEAGDEEVMAAAALANADEFILPLPDGFNTKVGERGVMLSGGQRQRLAIARAVLRNPRILILDEPTSSLDYHSERLIQEALERLASHRTVITIAHRLSLSATRTGSSRCATAALSISAGSRSSAKEPVISGTCLLRSRWLSLDSRYDGVPIPWQNRCEGKPDLSRLHAVWRQRDSRRGHRDDRSRH